MKLIYIPKIRKEVFIMANINDYLLWRGDIPLSNENAFNEIDSMILARFSYLLFSRLYLFRQNKIANYKFIFSLKGILKKFHTLSFSNCMNFKYTKK